jgi:2-oxoglutarate dehydrogenase E2 component (dihydrolipoamide succinyltransferase)
MPVELKVPQVGESVTEVVIADWLKSVGDRVEADEPVVSIETDKVTVELRAPVSGVISEIKLSKGAEATVGQVIGYMEAGGAAAEAPKSAAAAPAKTATGPSPDVGEKTSVTQAASPSAAIAPDATAGKDLPGQAVISTTPDDGAPAIEAQAVRDALPPQAYARVIPSARRALREHGMRPEEVQPSGPDGRLLREDVERKAKSEPQPSAPKPSTRAPVPSAHGREEEVVAMTPMRRRIAERLVESQQTAALLTTFNEVDMSEVMALRQEFQPFFQEKYGIKLGFMSFFLKATIEALKLVPQVNAEIRGTDIVYRNYYDIGVAVGGGKGLVVPIIRNAEQLSFAELELAIAEFAKRAKSNALKLDELQGGTFTISNGGIYGSLLSTPIINPPQSGILGLHAIQERPVVRDGQIVARPMMYVALTYDHRLVDGREAVTFLKRIKECVERPNRILLEV